MGVVGRSFSRTARYLIIYLLIVAAVGFLFHRMPTSYIPDEDQGILLVQAMLPSGSTLEQTEKVMNRVRDHFLEHEKDGVESFMSVAGISFGGQGQNMALGFAKLKDWKLRQRPDLKVKAIAGRAMGAFSQIKERHGLRLPAAAGHRTGDGHRV